MKKNYTRGASAATQVNLYVFLKSLSSFKYSPKSSKDPSGF